MNNKQEINNNKWYANNTDQENFIKKTIPKEKDYDETIIEHFDEKKEILTSKKISYKDIFNETLNNTIPLTNTEINNNK